MRGGQAPKATQLASAELGRGAHLVPRSQDRAASACPPCPHPHGEAVGEWAGLSSVTGTSGKGQILGGNNGAV